MSAVIDREKRYIPISGEEAIDLILNEFYKELVNSGLFPLHRVWHEFEIQGGVRVKGWSTKVAEVKFAVSRTPPDGPIIDSDAMERTEDRLDVRIAPQAPDLLRETLPTFACPKCGREFKSKPAQSTHTTVWCKSDPDYLKKKEAESELAIRFDAANLPAPDEGQTQPDQASDAP